MSLEQVSYFKLTCDVCGHAEEHDVPQPTGWTFLACDVCEEHLSYGSRLICPACWASFEAWQAARRDEA